MTSRGQDDLDFGRGELARTGSGDETVGLAATAGGLLIVGTSTLAYGRRKNRA